MADARGARRANALGAGQEPVTDSETNHDEVQSSTAQEYAQANEGQGALAVLETDIHAVEGLEESGLVALTSGLSLGPRNTDAEVSGHRLLMLPPPRLVSLTLR